VIRAVRLPLVLACLIGLAGPLLAQTETDEEAMAGMLRSAAHETAGKLAGRPVLLRVLPDDAHPMVRQIFTEEALAAGSTVTGEDGKALGRLNVDVRGIRMSAVSLQNSSYLRNLSATIGVLADDRRDGTVLWSKEYRLVRADTVLGPVPQQSRDIRDESAPGWTESILTPLLVTATAIVIVILLFFVRGS
jgi:hypothetical protein